MLRARPLALLLLAALSVLALSTAVDSARSGGAAGWDLLADVTATRAGGHHAIVQGDVTERRKEHLHRALAPLLAVVAAVGLGRRGAGWEASWHRTAHALRTSVDRAPPPLRA